MKNNIIFLYSHLITPVKRQWKTLLDLTIDECGSIIARNSVFDCHLAIENSVLTIFDLRSLIVLKFSIAVYPVC